MENKGRAGVPVVSSARCLRGGLAEPMALSPE